jgi:serine/threonine protein phosphatase PrpC
VLLYTDGLVEEHGDIDIATHHVAALLSSGREQPLTELTNHIVDTVAGQTHRDDLAVLAIRVNRHQPARETGEYATPTR